MTLVTVIDHDRKTASSGGPRPQSGGSGATRRIPVRSSVRSAALRTAMPRVRPRVSRRRWAPAGFRRLRRASMAHRARRRSTIRRPRPGGCCDGPGRRRPRTRCRRSTADNPGSPRRSHRVDGPRRRIGTLAPKERDRRLRLGFRLGTATGERPAGPTPREVAIEVDLAGIAARLGSPTVGVEEGHDREAQVRRHRDAAETVGEFGHRPLVTVGSADDGDVAALRLWD